MSIDTLKRAALFVVFILVQTMILGRIHLFGFATPLLYVYFVLQLPRNYPKWAGLLWAFSLGLVIDIFTDTPGLAAASLTLIALLQPYYFELFVPRDSADNLRPSLAALGSTRYTFYAGALVLLFCIVFYSLEFFNLFNWFHWLQCIAGSTVITLVLIFTFEIAKAR